MSTPYDWLDRNLASIHKANWYRSTQTITSKAGTIATIDGREMLMFASNNYLGLAGDRRLIEAAMSATQMYGTGSTGSRLVTGHLALHEELEQAIANLKNTEAALVFSSGYLANLGAISAVVGARDLILGDAYNHSCLKKGGLLSGAMSINYLHLDIADLAAKLQENRAKYRRCLITTDSVFSMDGDLAPLRKIMDLAARYDCMVLVDEAHGTGVFGDRGGGLTQSLAIEQDLIQVGTLSKALGSLGGYVAGSAKLIDYLRNRAATWIYTTALSPADTGAAIAAINLVQKEPERRQQLWQNVKFLQQGLQDLGIHAIAFDSPIIALKFGDGDIDVTMHISQQLRQNGFFAPAIRPPTVPTARIRLTLMATHTTSQIQTLLQCLANI
ncbi:MAG: 8-amino-7-oxononanoate synthase [Pseudanabaena sp. M090S1SP1A06QC]|nr:8-amino-7-oxononanoate synthase [Pseudanabaena sp. M53BS1SP1A06MG]MCA6581748.1 8-amino-7-oxononanoate synthase [Pseudanabaena sp. M34BS1SP1A06MG]MCA6585283.1 8-amino-7-oxononanoate synthase [Pseudanabaena sp. M051S1SP1A06QC]MCA6589692.1 8-amino-7-oxononanoate synthase [Pseudanabaena sp. M109S1SP1A06QC]MCA6593228.1 8-amino-7-oxononanoate synthase [Pseudanabaena sp. M38BS1SP1A06MG]MCA6600985.1 8-amino-7-oxononanoate synthase [Pseudanabaena sp. M57BS1SP1A06MG]MCA6604105.1 8-amino-7-oxononanoa